MATRHHFSTLVPLDSDPCVWSHEAHAWVCLTRRDLYDAVHEAQRLPDSTPRKQDRVVAAIAKHAAHSCDPAPGHHTPNDPAPAA